MGAAASVDAASPLTDAVLASSKVKIAQQLKLRLAAEEASRKEAGKTDEEITAELTAAIPGVIVFNQLDADHSGSIDSKELKRLLYCLPRKKPLPPDGGWPGGEEPPFVPIEDIVTTLDADQSGDVDLAEWLANLSKLPGLQAAITQSLDPVTGKVSTYRSLEEQLDRRLTQAETARTQKAALDAALAVQTAEGFTTMEAAIEAAAADEAQKAKLEAVVAIQGAEGFVSMEAAIEAATTELAKREEQATKLQSSIGSAGVVIFRQLDSDSDGKLDRAEIVTLLRKLQEAQNPGPMTKDTAELLTDEATADKIIDKLDSDKDGVIDMDEWLYNLDTYLPLKELIEKSVDPETGKLKTSDVAEAAAAEVEINTRGEEEL